MTGKGIALVIVKAFCWHNHVSHGQEKYIDGKGTVHSPYLVVYIIQLTKKEAPYLVRNAFLCEFITWKFMAFHLYSVQYHVLLCRDQHRD